MRGELIVDLFAGGGGASSAIEMAFGRSPDFAINHDPEAIALHAANHPRTRHLVADVWDVSPLGLCERGSVGLLWASPDCTFHSKARGGKPFRDEENPTGRRALPDVVIRWVEQVRPRAIGLENVWEFQDWGPLDEENRPIKSQRGEFFREWVGKLRAQGYVVEWRLVCAADFGAPTSRKRLFLIARCDGRPIVWPTATHGPGLAPCRTAAECIDWNIPSQSIFGRKKPLAENTMRRIARGLQRFVFDAAEPFIVPVSHSGDARVHSIREPLRTITASSRSPFALIAPTLIHSGNGERKAKGNSRGQDPRVYNIREPLTTVMAGGVKHALITAFLAKHYGGHEGHGQDVRDPLSTVTARDHHGLVEAVAA